jgi:hypothetical protein
MPLNHHLSPDDYPLDDTHAIARIRVTHLVEETPRGVRRAFDASGYSEDVEPDDDIPREPTAEIPRDRANLAIFQQDYAGLS